MHTFTLDRRSWWVARAFSRNPLVRWTDRVEACAMLLVILVAAAAAAVCVAAAVGVYRSHAKLYAEQSRTRHAVTTTVVETDSRPRPPHTTRISVMVMWLVGGDGARGGERDIGHSDWVNTERAVRGGDRLDIWVDDAGVPVVPPTRPSQAVVDAAGVGAGMWCSGAVGLVALVGMVRSPLNRIRREQWAREIEGLAGGGLRNRPR
jgi:hypothetical protein